MAILSKGCKPDNFEPPNSLKLKFTNIWGISSNSVEYKSFLESNSPEILPLCETNFNGSVNSDNLSVMGYLLLIQKDYIIHMYDLAVYMKEGRTSFCTGFISRKLSRFLLILLTSSTSLCALLLFPLSITFFVVMQSFYFYFI